MYSQGESFYFEIAEEETEIQVLENVILGEKEYLITDDLEGKIRVFLYDDLEETIELVEDKNEVFDIIEYWKEEYLNSGNINYDEDYYEFDDKDIDNINYDEEYGEDGY
jgi:DNA-directed RNA polymerase subunit delta